MKKLIKYLSLMTMICCIFVSSSLCVLAKDSASPIEHKSKITAIASTKKRAEYIMVMAIFFQLISHCKRHHVHTFPVIL